MKTYRDAKAMAKAMREALAKTGTTITHSQALEVVAKQFELPSWNVLSARIEEQADDAPASPIAFELTAPIVRIFSIEKAHEFYLGFLGFTVDWEHRYGDNFPLYTQISRGSLKLHLSEHSGDATPGSNMCIYMKGIRAFHAELMGKSYRYMKPGLENSDGRLEVEVIDPFSNHMRFMEVLA